MALRGALLVALAALLQGAALGAMLPEEVAAMMASGRYAGLVSDEICHGGPVACGGACSNTVVTCTRLPTASGNVWLNTGNSTCPRGGYCVDGECMNVAPAACAEPQPTSAYECSGPGYFPDITSCTYFFCTEDHKAYAFDCADYSTATNYDQRLHRCVPSSEAPTCSKVSCMRSYNSSRVQVYSAHPNVYVVCRTDNVAEAVVVKCPDNKVMDVASGQCVDGCLAAGRYRPVDAEDDRTYVECVKVYSGSSSSNRFGAPQRRVCPGSAFFDEALGQCSPVRPPPPTTTLAPATEAPATEAPVQATYKQEHAFRKYFCL